MESLQIQFIPIDNIEYNEGQIKGVPANPRKREDNKQKALEKSIEELPEMATARALLVYPLNDKYIVLGGNRRLEAQKALGKEKVPVIILPEYLSEEKLRRIVLLDNEQTGETDWELIEQQWKLAELKDWGIAMPKGFLKPKSETAKLSELEYKSMYYTPKEVPNITLEECLNLTKYEEKIKYIDSLKLSEKKKRILKIFAQRFIKIDFESVANYYFFNASNEEQKAIERLRLVLLDGGAEGYIEDDLLKIVNV